MAQTELTSFRDIWVYGDFLNDILSAGSLIAKEI